MTEAPGFHRRPNRPDEAEEFAPDGRHDLLFAFPPRRQGAIARVQPVLRLPGDSFHLLTDGLLTLEERPPPGRPVPVRPGRLNHDAPQVCIAGFGNAATADPVAAGMLAGYRAAIAHQLRGPAKARDLAEFGHDRGRRHLREALLHESSRARTMLTDRILTCRCDTTLVGRERSSD